MFKKGFTLIELLVVISIISLLSSIVFSSLQVARSEARDANRRSDVNALRNAFELYRLQNNNQYPNNPASTQVDNMNTGSSDITPYISEIPIDPTSATPALGYRYRTFDRSGYVLMMQFENDSYNSWCKFVMEPGDIGATNSWATNATYLDMSDPACQ